MPCARSYRSLPGSAHCMCAHNEHVDDVSDIDTRYTLSASECLAQNIAILNYDCLIITSIILIWNPEII